MRQYIMRRLLLLIPVLFVVSLIIFSLMRIVPGDAALLKSAGAAEAGGVFDPEVYQALHRKLGLDKPWPQQYGEWIWGILSRGDLGTSFWTEEPVTLEILRRLPVTIELAIGATLIALLVAIPGGILAATRQDTPLDYLARLFSIGGLSMPGFWIGTLLLVLPAIWFRYIPPLGYVEPWVDPWENFRQFIFPSVAMGVRYSADTLRMTRSQLLEVLRQDYIRTAWAKGLRERVVLFQHALRNALIPVVTIAGIHFGYLLGRTVIMETVFGLPGLGRLTLTSIFERDYPQIQGNILFIAAFFVVVNLVIDIMYAWLDPRIRYS